MMLCYTVMIRFSFNILAVCYILLKHHVKFEFSNKLIVKQS